MTLVWISNEHAQTHVPERRLFGATSNHVNAMWTQASTLHSAIMHDQESRTEQGKLVQREGNFSSSKKIKIQILLKATTPKRLQDMKAKEELPGSIIILLPGP